MELLKQQYELVKSARAALLSYLDTIPFERLKEPQSTYSNKDICYLLAHNASVYVHWLVNFARQKNVVLFDANDLKTMLEIRLMYEQVDIEVAVFLDEFKDAETLVEQFIKSKNDTLTTSVLQLFTHVITHEFHHKGQVLNITRQLGFTPVDTDIIRT